MVARVIVVIVLVVPVSPPPAVVENDPFLLDFWEALFLNGSRVGHAHTVARKVEEDGKTIIRTTSTWVLKIKRGNQILDIAIDKGTTETAQGKVKGTFMRQYVGKEQAVEVVGTVVDRQLRLTRDDKVRMHPAPWDDETLSQYRLDELLRSRRLKPGEHFSFRSFDHEINLVTRKAVTAKDFEMIEPFAGAPKVRLLRVEIHPEKIASVPQAPLRMWLDAAATPVRTETEVTGLGKLVLYRTSAERAQLPANAADLADLFAQKHIRINKRIDRPLDTNAAVYRITARAVESPADVFSRDSRQQIKNLKGQTFELHVRARRLPKEADDRAKVGREYTQSSFYITSADALVRKHTQEAIGTEKDPWAKAVKIEKWVFDHMTPTLDQGIIPADQVARTLKGDCTEYAMLMAAMCRAAGSGGPHS